MPRCCDCGLLATRASRSEEVREAIPETRANGLLPEIRTLGDSIKFRFSPTANFFCYASSPAFPERPESAENEHESVTVARQIAVEISCPAFRKYLLGRSPKEHEEMAFLETVRGEQKQFEAKSEAIAERRHNELRDDQKKNSEYNAFLTRLSLLIAALSAACALFTVWMNYRPDRGASPPAIHSGTTNKLPTPATPADKP